MNTLGRILLLVGGLVLALLVGVLIGRSQRVEPTDGAAQAVQITTAPPPAMPAITPLPAAPPVQAPQPTAVPKIVAPDMQVQEDAAAVGMTTRDHGDIGASDDAPPPKSAAGGGGDPSRSQPIG